MPLPEKLLKAALIGTSRQTFEPEERIAATTSNEGQLLLAVARAHLREKAGFLPGHTGLPLPMKSDPDKTRQASDAALRYLRLMLGGHHSYALIEWFMAAIRARLHVREDLLPRLLLLGQNKPDWRPYLLPLVGQRGLWLAMEIRDQNWKWVFNTDEYTYNELVDYGELGEIDLLQKLNEQPIEKIDPINTKWSQYRVVWSHEFTRKFLKRWETVEANRSAHVNHTMWVEYIMNRWISITYLFPLELRDEVSRRLANAAFLRGAGKPFFESMNVIYDFRQQMVAAVSAPEGSAA